MIQRLYLNYIRFIFKYNCQLSQSSTTQTKPAFHTQSWNLPTLPRNLGPCFEEVLLSRPQILKHSACLPLCISEHHLSLALYFNLFSQPPTPQPLPLSRAVYISAQQQCTRIIWVDCGTHPQKF